MYKSFWEAGREPRGTKEWGETHTDLAAKLHGSCGEEEEGKGGGGESLRAVAENERAGVRVVGVDEAVRQALELWGTDTQVVEGMFRVEPCDV